MNSERLENSHTSIRNLLYHIFNHQLLANRIQINWGLKLSKRRIVGISPPQLVPFVGKLTKLKV